jgi:transcriptional regulator with XRE-family HTH domain
MRGGSYVSDNFLDKYREVGKRIAFYRGKRGLSQESLGEKSIIVKVILVKSKFLARRYLIHWAFCFR